MEPRQLTLVKGEQRFIFRYLTGGEATVLDSLIDMASDDRCELDWFDAAVLSYQIGRSLSDPGKAPGAPGSAVRRASRKSRDP